MAMIYDPILTAVRRELAEREIAARSLAAELGLPQQTLSNILNGKRRIGGITFARIMEARPQWWALLNNNHNNAGHPSSRERS